MSGQSGDDYAGGHRSGREGRSTLLGLVRKVSRSAKTRDTSNRNNNGPPSSTLAASSSSSGYKRVSPNLAPATAYPSMPSTSPGKEKIVWGPPPASKTSRTIEGVELADDGPVGSAAVIGNEASTWSSSDKRRTTPRRRHQHQRTLSPASTKMELEGVAEIEGASPRRSIDSLLPSMNSHIPLLSYAERDYTGGMKSSATPRRAVSVKVDGPKLRDRDSMVVSSTARAKPARESLMPLHFTSPYQGYWTNHRSDETEAVDEEITRLRDVFRNKGPLWAVSRGWKKGIFMTFEEAEQQTRNFPGPLMRQFPTVDEAIEFLQSQSAKGKSPSSITFAENANHDSANRNAIGTPPPRNGLSRLPSYPRSPDKCEFQRVLRSPSTNPFLAESERLRNASASEAVGGEGFLNLNRSLSNSIPSGNALAVPVQRSLSRDDMNMENSNPPRTIDLLLPPSILNSTTFNTNDSINSNYNKSPPAIAHHQPFFSPTCLSIFYCADLSSSADFYCNTLGFATCADVPLHEDQTLLSYKGARHPSLALRRKMSSPSSSNDLPISSTLLAVPLPSDLQQLHADIALRLKQNKQLVATEVNEQSRVAKIEDIQEQVSLVCNAVCPL